MTKAQKKSVINIGEIPPEMRSFLDEMEEKVSNVFLQTVEQGETDVLLKVIPKDAADRMPPIKLYRRSEVYAKTTDRLIRTKIARPLGRRGYYLWVRWVDGQDYFLDMKEEPN